MGRNNALRARLATWMYTALGPADLGAVYPGALLAHRALFGPECTRTVHYLGSCTHVVYIYNSCHTSNYQINITCLQVTVAMLGRIAST